MGLALGCTPPLGPKKDAGAQPVSSQNHPFFPIGPGSLHGIEGDGAITCQSCHTQPTTFRSFSCLGCHAHRRTGYDEAAGTQGLDEVHAGNVSYRYDSRYCLDCHPTGSAAEVGRAAHTDFPIGLGSAHERIGCTECHTQGTRTTATCTECHRDSDGDSQFDHDVAPMAAVHGTDMATLGYAWDTGACRACHPGAEVPGLLAHDRAFPIDAGTVHGDARVGCADCHPNRQDHRQLACVACHQQVDGPDGGARREVHGETRMRELHERDGGTRGYAFEARACFVCHRRAQVPGELSHEPLFPIGPGTSHEVGSTIPGDPPVLVTCSSCHVAAIGSGVDGGLAEGGAARRNVECTGCHAHAEATLQPSHGELPDYRWQSESCVFCHLGGAMRLEHRYFPIDAGTAHALGQAVGQPPATVTCSSCHASQTQRRLLSCTWCHRHDASQSAADHGAAMGAWGYAYDPGACFGCHPRSEVPGRFDHEPIWTLAAPSGHGRHAGLGCVECHPNREDRTSLSCVGCHEAVSPTDARSVHGQARMDAVHAGLSTYQFSPAICVGCHRDGTARLRLEHTWFPVGAEATHALSLDGGAGMSCASCHPSSGAFEAGQVNCTTCHWAAGSHAPVDVHGQARMGELHQGVDSYRWASGACLDCHPRGEPTGNFVHGAFPIGPGQKHQGLVCSSCHRGTGLKSDVEELDCLGCHEATVNRSPTLAQLHQGLPTYVASSPACFGCHPHSEQVGAMDHTRFFPVAVGDRHASTAYLASVPAGQTRCTACHARRDDRTDELCQPCHSRLLTPAPPLVAHARMLRSLDNTSPGCKKCHAEPTPVYRLRNHPSPGYGHEGATCQSCHQRRRLDKPYAIDFSRSACSCLGSGCHDHHDEVSCR